MRGYALFLIYVLILGPSAFAAQSVVPAPKTRAKFLNTLLSKCNDGIARACYDYGVELLASPQEKDQQRGEKYVRRACTLAYSPACKQHATVGEPVPEIMVPSPSTPNTLPVSSPPPSPPSPK